MTADKARQIAKDKTLEGLDKIMDGIEAAAHNGDFQYHYYQKINAAVRSELETKGFDVEVLHNRDGWCTRVSWL